MNIGYLSNIRFFTRSCSVNRRPVCEELEGVLVRQREPGISLPFLFLDPPDHNRLRSVVIHQFTPERIEGMRDLVVQIVNELLDAQRNRGQLDIVDDFAHPLPVRVISKMLGIPIQDKDRFEVWVTALVRTVEPPQNVSEAADLDERGSQAVVEMREYLRDLIITRRDRPGDDLISALVVSISHDDSGQMNGEELLASLQLLISAGFETTVNSIGNGMLTLLRHPDFSQGCAATLIWSSGQSRRCCATILQCTFATAQPSLISI